MKPDDRKGKLRVCKATDGPNHRSEAVVPHVFLPEDDFIIFPQEAEMKFIPKPGVLVIKFSDDPSRHVLWSQNRPGRSRTTSSPPTSTPPTAIHPPRAVEVPSRPRSRNLTGPGGGGQRPGHRYRSRSRRNPRADSVCGAMPAAPARRRRPPRPRVRGSARPSGGARELGAPQGASPSAQGAPAGGIDHAAMAAMLVGMQREGWPARAAPG